MIDEKKWERDAYLMAGRDMLAALEKRLLEEFRELGGKTETNTKADFAAARNKKIQPD